MLNDYFEMYRIYAWIYYGNITKHEYYFSNSFIFSRISMKLNTIYSRCIRLNIFHNIREMFSARDKWIGTEKSKISNEFGFIVHVIVLCMTKRIISAP